MKKIIITGALSLITLTSCGTTENKKVSSQTPSSPISSDSKAILINKTYSLGGTNTATLNGKLIVNGDKIASVVIDNPQGPIKTFADGINEKTVGKSVKWLKVDTISGASLTTAAFNEFIQTLN